MTRPADALDAAGRALVVATQGGLPLVDEPWAAVARAVGIAEDEVLARIAQMVRTGVIRRVGVVPNHYALGYTANGMTVWDVEDARVDELGERVGALDFVTHCYRRPRRRPVWPYNLFAMVHGRDRAQVEAGRARIGQVLGSACAGSDILYSSRILKKTGMRIAHRTREDVASCSG